MPWLGLRAPTAAGTGSIPCWGAKILHAAVSIQDELGDRAQGAEPQVPGAKTTVPVFGENKQSRRGELKGLNMHLENLGMM